MALTVDDDNIQAWLDPLMDAGLIPKETRRIIIDIPTDDAVKVYYESFADVRMFKIDLSAALAKADVISLADMEST